jgi:hypothetical protein
MNLNANRLIENLNHPGRAVRLESLTELFRKIDNGELVRTRTGNDVNNHIHTTYSFSPYSPAKAVYMAYRAGLATAGIMDHDSISGAAEFISAGRIAGIATTIGVECRADFSQTPLAGRKINNPDQNSIAYVALHGIPHTQIERVKSFFAPYTMRRNRRNRKMTEQINGLMAGCAIRLDFDRDVVPLSQAHEGGSITERHLLYALSLKLIAAFGPGEKLVDFLKTRLKTNPGPKILSLLVDSANPYYDYDLLGFLKREMVSAFYIPATDECPDVREVIRLAEATDAVSSYAYLGDVEDSVTGDKKTQKFEDDYLELLFQVLRVLRFNAVTYMPSRNTPAQLERVRSLCDDLGFFQISGEDINSPRQSFICRAMQDEKFRNLFDSTWALIGHEIAATVKPGTGMFSAATLKKLPELRQRIAVYRKIGLSETDKPEID